MSKEDILARIPERWGKYLSISEGWYEVVFQLDRDIAALDPDYTIAQVKEKFGGLRFYIDTISPDAYEEANRLIAEAEKKVENMCEQCGQPGVLRTDIGWYRTLCDADYTKKKS